MGAATRARSSRGGYSSAAASSGGGGAGPLSTESAVVASGQSDGLTGPIGQVAGSTPAAAPTVEPPAAVMGGKAAAAVSVKRVAEASPAAAVRSRRNNQQQQQAPSQLSSSATSSTVLPAVAPAGSSTRKSHRRTGSTVSAGGIAEEGTFNSLASAAKAEEATTASSEDLSRPSMQNPSSATLPVVSQSAAALTAVPEHSAAGEAKVDPAPLPPATASTNTEASAASTSNTLSSVDKVGEEAREASSTEASNVAVEQALDGAATEVEAKIGNKAGVDGGASVQARIEKENLEGQAQASIPAQSSLSAPAEPSQSASIAQASSSTSTAAAAAAGTSTLPQTTSPPSERKAQKRKAVDTLLSEAQQVTKGLVSSQPQSSDASLASRLTRRRTSAAFTDAEGMKEASAEGGVQVSPPAQGAGIGGAAGAAKLLLRTSSRPHRKAAPAAAPVASALSVLASQKDAPAAAVTEGSSAVNAHAPLANGPGQPAVSRRMPTRTAKVAKKEDGLAQATGVVSSPANITKKGAGTEYQALPTAQNPASSLEQEEQLGPGKRKRKPSMWTQPPSTITQHSPPAPLKKEKSSEAPRVATSSTQIRLTPAGASIVPSREITSGTGSNLRIRLRLSIARDADQVSAPAALGTSTTVSNKADAPDAQASKRRKSEAAHATPRRADDPPPLLSRAGWVPGHGLRAARVSPSALQPRDEAEAILFRTPPSFHKGGKKQHTHPSSPKRKLSRDPFSSEQARPHSSSGSARPAAVSPPATSLVKEEMLALEQEGEPEEEEDGDFHKVMLLDDNAFKLDGSQKDAVKDEDLAEEGGARSLVNSSGPSRRNSFHEEAVQSGNERSSGSDASHQSEQGEGEIVEDTPATTPRTVMSNCEEGDADEETQVKATVEEGEASTPKEAESSMLAQKDRVFCHALPLVRRRTDQHAGQVTLSLPFEETQNQSSDLVNYEEPVVLGSSPRIVTRTIQSDSLGLRSMAMRRILSTSSNTSTFGPNGEETIQRSLLRNAPPHHQIHHLRHPQDEILLASPSDALRAKIIAQDEVEDMVLDAQGPSALPAQEAPDEGSESPWRMHSPLSGSRSQAGDEEDDNAEDVFVLAETTALSQLDLVWGDQVGLCASQTEGIEDDGDLSTSSTARTSSPRLAAGERYHDNYFEDEEEEEEEDFVELLGRPRLRSSPRASDSVTPQPQSSEPRADAPLPLPPKGPSVKAKDTNSQPASRPARSPRLASKNIPNIAGLRTNSGKAASSVTMARSPSKRSAAPRETAANKTRRTRAAAASSA